jgi:hypothetical protein
MLVIACFLNKSVIKISHDYPKIKYKMIGMSKHYPKAKTFIMIPQNVRVYKVRNHAMNLHLTIG